MLEVKMRKKKSKLFLEILKHFAKQNGPSGPSGDSPPEKGNGEPSPARPENSFFKMA